MICDGPRNAKIIAIGQTPGPDELRSGRPFSGSSGWEWGKMLEEAGLSRSNIFCFNVTDTLPPAGKVENFFSKKREADKNGLPFIMGRRPNDDCIVEGIKNIHEVVDAIQPNVIIALGDLALWALTGESGIIKWRGSIMESTEISGKVYKVISTYNPAFVQRNWSTRSICIQDHRRAFKQSLYPEIKYPKRNYLVRPIFDEAMDAIELARGKETTNDIETWGGQIACVGIGYNKEDAACIPFMCSDKPAGYWTPDEELLLTLKLKDVLTDPNTSVIFQHGHFDAQIYIAQWGYIPRVSYDTMIAQHVCYPDSGNDDSENVITGKKKAKSSGYMKKSLDFMASLYCNYYRFWKDDGRNWTPDLYDDEEYWKYNCDDCCYTYEVKEVQQNIIQKRKLENALAIQMRMFYPILKMMLRGVNVDLKFKEQMKGDLQLAMRERAEWFEKVLGYPFNPMSNGKTGQMQRLFYDDLNVKKVMSKAPPYNPTLDDAAIETVKKRAPLLKPLLEACQEYRSLNTFKSNFAEMRLSPDDRIRCSINMSFVKTYRLSTSENIWGEGRNLQNMSKGKEKD